MSRIFTGLNLKFSEVIFKFGMFNVSLEYSQPIDIVLYEYNTAYGDISEEMELSYDTNPDVKEPFLGNRIGYIKGVHIEDNVDKSDPEKYSYIEIEPDRMNEILAQYRGDISSQSIPMIQEMFYGYTGLFQPIGYQQMLMSTEVTTKSSIAMPDDFTEDDQVSDNSISETTTNSSITMDGLTVESEDEYEQKLKEILLQSEIEASGFIHNLILWDGSVVNEDGIDIDYIYDKKMYIIAIEPVMEVNRVFNSFLGFRVNSDMIEAYLSKAEYEPLYGCLAGDPVDLIDGSFIWDYTDIALNGRNNLELSRHYSSKYAENDYGFGKGWTTNFTYKVEEKPLYTRVTMPNGDSIYKAMS